MALLQPHPSCEALFSQLRASIQLSVEAQAAKQYITESRKPDETFYNDRKFYQNDRSQRNQLPQRNNETLRLPYNTSRQQGRFQRKPFQANKFARNGNQRCYVCKKIGCISYNHPPRDNDNAKRQFLSFVEDSGYETPNDAQFRQYLLEYEGTREDGDEHGFDERTGEKAVHFLIECAFLHRMTVEDIYQQDVIIKVEQFVLNEHYRTKY